MIPFIGWLADRGVDQAAWASMSPAMQNSIKAEYEAAVPANQREYNLGAGFENIDPAQDIDPAQAVVTVEDGTDTFSLADAIARMQADIRATEARKAAEAQRLSARNIGIAGRRGREALLATGRTGGEIEQLLGAGTEGGARSLNDLLQQLSLQSQQAQTQAAQFGIGAQLSQEEINTRLLGLTQQAGQFEQTIAEQIRQFDIAQRNRQQAALWGGVGSLVGTIGGGLAGFALGGPPGAFAGAKIGQGAFGG